jgi:hypothetical protein
LSGKQLYPFFNKLHPKRFSIDRTAQDFKQFWIHRFNISGPEKEKTPDVSASGVLK